jgi:hypothetical protein
MIPETRILTAFLWLTEQAGGVSYEQLKNLLPRVKPETRNPKLETRNPKLETLKLNP